MASFRLDRLNALIDAGGWTTAELAEATGANYQFVYRLRRGDWSDINSGNLASLARALEVSTDYLLGMTDDPRPAQPVAGLSLAESRLVYEVAGAEHEIRELLAIIGELSPEQRAILRNVAEQMARANTPRLIE